MEFFDIKLSHCIVGTFFYMLQMFKLNRENRKTSKCKFGFDWLKILNQISSSWLLTNPFIRFFSYLFQTTWKYDEFGEGRKEEYEYLQARISCFWLTGTSIKVWLHLCICVFRITFLKSSPCLLKPRQALWKHIALPKKNP